MKIAVIVPAFNAAPWIGDTLHSVLAQTYDDLVIIVVDDGSSDGTADVAREVLQSSKRPWQLIRQPNAGVSAARNLGWRATDAEWIQFLDADDFLAPSKIEHQAKLGRDAPEETAMIASPWQEIQVHGTSWRNVGPMHDRFVAAHPSPYSILAYSSHLLLGPHLFRRSWLETVGGFDETLRVDEDLDFFLRIAKRGGGNLVAPAARALFFWRQHPMKRLGSEGARYDAVAVCRSYLVALTDLARSRPVNQWDLSADEAVSLWKNCTRFMRLLYRYDRGGFRYYLGVMNRLFGTFLPYQPWYLKALTYCIGFESAETVAGGARSMKRLLGAPIKE